ncbi:MAG TPA: nickel insertion protein, partial [Symbiobacteriaceae bacterium]|nr:nickel insertion protein [Symbiobacteriaceae bacterium]
MVALHLDCFAGISGDMFLGLLLDLGLDQGLLEQELARLQLGGYRLETRRVTKNGIAATHVRVVVAEHDHHQHR